jgi:hypothetical protein
MIFVENVTSFSESRGVGIVEGKTIVMDENKYCEYYFVGVGASISKSMPLDRTITQGYVYGIESVDDYCGFFVGGSFNTLATVHGGAYATPRIYAKILGGMGIAPSLSASVTWYKTSQLDWIYGHANLVTVTNPYSPPPLNSSPYA